MNQKRSTVLIALGIALLVVFVVAKNWAHKPLTMTNIGTMLVIGIALGAIYAVSAAGLVVTYTTTGIFNFAHGAIGCFLAFCYWELRVNRHWAAPFAIFTVVLVIAPLIGLVLDRLIMRRLINAALVVQLMVTVGIMLLFMGLTATMWKPTTGRGLPAFFQDTRGFKVGDIIVTWHRFITAMVALAIAIGLRLLLHRTRLGIAMRAVVDNRGLAALNGARPGLVSSFSWMLGCSLAGIAGILIAPDLFLVVENLTLVIVIAFAAAAIGQLRNLPLTFVGAMIIGISQSFLSNFLNLGNDWPKASEGIAPVVLICAVLLLPPARLATGKLRLTRRTERLTKPWEAFMGAGVIVGLALIWTYGLIPGFTDRSDVWLNRGSQALAFGIIMLSLVPLTGWAGQVSFANFAIAGFGAVMYSKLGGQHGDAMGLVWTVLISAPLGVLIALPALRLQGLYLALATMAVAEGGDKLFFHHPRAVDPVSRGRIFQQIDVFGIKLGPDHRRAFVIFLAIVFALLFLGFELLRRSRFARRWIAMADSPAASATVGVNLTATKIGVFALSSAIAALGGALYALYIGNIVVDSFPFFLGLPIVLLLAAQGVRFPIAAFMGLLGFMSFPALYEVSGKPRALSAIEVVGPGIAALVMAFRPEGGVFYAGRDLASLLPWRRDAREEKALRISKDREISVLRDEVGELGLQRPFTEEKVAQLDRVLHVADDLARRPNGAPTDVGRLAGGAPVR